jgi:hypothetical protein
MSDDRRFAAWFMVVFLLAWVLIAANFHQQNP